MNVLKVTLVIAVVFLAALIAGCHESCASKAAMGSKQEKVVFRPTGTGFYGPDVVQSHSAE